MKTTKSFCVFSYAALFKIVYGEVMMLSNLSSQEGHQDSLLFFCFFFLNLFLNFLDLSVLFATENVLLHLISGYVHASGKKNRPLCLNECVDRLLTILLNVFIETNLAMMGCSVIHRKFFCFLFCFLI